MDIDADRGKDMGLIRLWFLDGTEDALDEEGALSALDEEEDPLDEGEDPLDEGEDPLDEGEGALDEEEDPLDEGEDPLDI